MQSDQALMGGIVKGDAGAFEALFARYSETVRRHLQGIVREAPAAEDLVQEVFLRVWTRAGQWQGEGQVRPWLLRIATNLALNHLRMLRRRPQQPLELPPEDTREGVEDLVPGWLIDAALRAPDALIELAELRDLILRQLAELPEDRRELFRLVYEEEMPLRDAASSLGIPEGTAKSRLHYTRLRLAREWKAPEGGREEER